MVKSYLKTGCHPGTKTLKIHEQNKAFKINV